MGRRGLRPRRRSRCGCCSRPPRWSSGRVARELRQRIKARFDHEGIEIPLPQRVVWHREEQAAEAAQDGTGAEPAVAAADLPTRRPGIARRRPPRRRAGQASAASSVIVVPVSAWLTGQPALAASAASTKSSLLIPSTTPRTVSLMPGDAGAGRELHVGARVQRRRRGAGLGQAVGEGHREARGVRGRDQLLGAGLAVGLLGAAGPGDVVGTRCRTTPG